MTHEDLLKIIQESAEKTKKLDDNRMTVFKLYMMIVTMSLSAVVEIDSNEICGMVISKVNEIKMSKTLNI